MGFMDPMDEDDVAKIEAALRKDAAKRIQEHARRLRLDALRAEIAELERPEREAREAADRAAREKAEAERLARLKERWGKLIGSTIIDIRETHLGEIRIDTTTGWMCVEGEMDVDGDRREVTTSVFIR